ncbi:VTT domain-containing protein [Asanoa sp. WMMD1127]|uniref:VTT domain-containing protein n=1 Tax=Asanoa sp. WMMD1127 TaxID=3016107 RepID=UPI002417A30D|nr:VTT domain-containing protein [Asanoa sp. WMMD1127]MDG4826949.1 VTT domain-containing protein [Asanoa sp. WMMD1127]
MVDLLTRLADLPPAVIYVIAFTLIAGETAVLLGLVFPAEATLLLVGFLSFTGTLDLRLSLALMVVAGLVGDSLAFRAGRRYGERLREGRWGERVGAARWAKAEGLLHRTGGRGILVARFVAFARTLVPRLAGAAGMPYRRFVIWNAPGVTLFVGASVLVGYLAGESYETVSEYLGKATGAVLILLGTIIAIVIAGRWLGRNPDPWRALVARAGALPPLRWVNQRFGVLFFLLTMRVGRRWALVANLVTGVALLFGVGFGLAYIMKWAVGQSGLSVVDDNIAGWFALRRTDPAVDAARETLGILRGSLLIIIVALVALVLAWRRGSWRGDLVTIVSTAGAFVPLVLLAVISDVTRAGALTPANSSVSGLFPSQNAVITAGFCTLAWLLSRGRRWPLRVALWTVAAAFIVSLSGARLYLGWSVGSETATSVLLGVMWTLFFMVAWASRGQAPAEPAPAAEPVSDAEDDGGLAAAPQIAQPGR